MNETYQLVQCSLTFQSDERIHVKWETYTSVSWRARIVVHSGSSSIEASEGNQKNATAKKIMLI